MMPIDRRAATALPSPLERKPQPRAAGNHPGAYQCPTPELFSGSVADDFAWRFEKWRIVTAPTDRSVHGAQSGAATFCGAPRPSIGIRTAESITSISTPIMLEKMPAARKKLLHMVVLLPPADGSLPDASAATLSGPRCFAEDRSSPG
ncbi:MAG: hypothetical protein WCO90_11165 [Planctomycetota bacterium]|jgi:hypothetical protein